MSRPAFEGLLIANITPFKDDEKRTLDLDKLDRLVDYLINEQQAGGLVTVGTTGESTSLSHEEKEIVIGRTIKAAKGRVPVLAGTGSASTEEAIALTRFAESHGASGALVVSPYYIRPDQSGLFGHFMKIARSTRLPIILYNHPGRTGVSIQVDTVLKLAAAADNIAGIKDCPNSLAVTTDLIRRCKAELKRPFSVLTGEDDAIFVNLCLGADGAIAASGHVLGRQIDQMIEHFKAGRLAQAREAQMAIIDLTRLLFAAPSPAPIKAALDIQGTDLGGVVRSPLVDVSEEMRRALASAIAKLKDRTH